MINKIGGKVWSCNFQVSIANHQYIGQSMSIHCFCYTDSGLVYSATNNKLGKWWG